MLAGARWERKAFMEGRDFWHKAGPPGHTLHPERVAARILTRAENLYKPSRRIPVLGVTPKRFIFRRGLIQLLISNREHREVFS